VNSSVNTSRIVEQVVSMKRNEQRESFRKWLTLAVAILALLPAYLMGPIAFTFKTTVKDLLRQELAGYEAATASDSILKAHQDYLNETLKRWGNDFAAAREKTASSETNDYKLMLDVSNRLSSIESKLDLLMRESQRDRKLQNGSGP